MKKTIKIKYVGWGETFDYKNYLIQKILEKHYNVILSEEPDYIFTTPFSHDYLKYSGVRIFYTAENITPDFNIYDYAIGFDEIEYGDRYIRVPNFITHPKYLDDLQLMCERHLTPFDNSKKKFCSYVCSNGAADSMRDYIFDEISKYKKIDSGGKYRNNINIPTGVEDKLEFQKQYKFSLAMENTSFKGYTTEKLVEAFAAGGLPIYWGDPDVNKYFNKKSFINISDFKTLAEAREKIKEIDNNPKLYLCYMKEPALIDINYPSIICDSFEKFLINIFEQPIELAYRRNRGTWGQRVENMIIKGTDLGESEKNSLFSKYKKVLFSFLKTK